MNNKEYAGFWIRFWAFLIDTIIVIIVLQIFISFIYGQNYWMEEQLFYGFWDVLLSYVMPFFATIWFWLKYLGTPGKMATKLKIVDAVSGEKMTTWQAVGRYFAYILAALPLGLGFFWIGIDKKKQGWHDKLAGTVVIRDTETKPVSFDESV